MDWDMSCLSPARDSTISYIHVVEVMATGNPLRVIIAGPPASGKGTQCEYIRDEYDVVHVSTGDILRRAASLGTDTGQLAKSYMDRGELVPDDVIITITLERLHEADCVEKGWILDGFPRTRVQANALLTNSITCDAFISLVVPDGTLIERVVGRRSDPATGKIYHMKYSPPPNEEVVSRLVQREDDTEEKVAVRIAAFHNNMSDILDLYKDTLIEIDGDRNPADIWSDIHTRLRAIRMKNAARPEAKESNPKRKCMIM